MRTVHAGFRTEGFGPFVYLFKKIGQEKYDLDLQPAPLFNREGAEADLLAGRINFLLGQHFTPVASTARGTPICWLAVASVQHTFSMVTRRDVEDVEELNGMSVLLPEARCPALNAILTLRKMGLEDKVKFLNSRAGSGPERDPETLRATRTATDFLNDVKEGRADFFMGYGMELLAHRMDLQAFQSPVLDIVAGPIVTTTPGFAYKDPELTKDILRAYSEALHAFKTDKEVVLDILLQERERLVRMGFNVDDKEILDNWYEHHAGALQERPFPTPASLEWTEYKAAVDAPDAAAGGLNAMRTVDMTFLLELDREGFFDGLWGGRR